MSAGISAQSYRDVVADLRAVSVEAFDGNSYAVALPNEIADLLFVEFEFPSWTGYIR